jgi:hypothetical protein
VGTVSITPPTLEERTTKLAEEVDTLAQAVLLSQKTTSDMIDALENMSRTLQLLAERVDDLETLATGRHDPAAWNRIRSRADKKEENDVQS